VVLALLLANLAFFAWTRGEANRTAREPDRHAQQVRPEAVRLLTPGSTAASAPQQAASAAEASASAGASSAAATRCFEAGPFNTAEVAAAEAALAASPAASALAQRWSRVSAEVPGKPATAAAVHHLRIEAATAADVAVLESLPTGLLIHAFVPCAAR
jgi:hypothetical protein